MTWPDLIPDLILPEPPSCLNYPWLYEYEYGNALRAGGSYEFPDLAHPGQMNLHDPAVVSALCVDTYRIQFAYGSTNFVGGIAASRPHRRTDIVPYDLVATPGTTDVRILVI